MSPTNPRGQLAFLPLNAPALAAGIHPVHTVIRVTPPSSRCRLMKSVTSGAVWAFGSGPGISMMSNSPGATSGEERLALVSSLADAVRGTGEFGARGEM